MAGIRPCLLYLLYPLSWMAGAPAGAQAPAPVSAQAAAQVDELYLEVILNGEATGLIMRFTQGASGLRSTVQNLRDLGLDPQLFGVAGLDEFDLDAVPGLQYAYDAARQSVALRVADALRAPYSVAARAMRQTAAASVTPGIVLNYDAYTQLGSDWRLSALNELRYFDRHGVFSSTGIASGSAAERGYVRYDTQWSQSDPDTLHTWQVGDLISSSLSWTRALRLGGVQWRKNFDLRPDLLTFPLAAMSGSAVVPTALSLYVNGVQQVQTQVPSGPFIIKQVAGLNGAGQATIVTRDAAGRSVSTSLPLYVDTRLLAAGLSDYAVELGALRRAYGVRSFSYASTPAASASLRHGLSDRVTVEAHAEAGRGLLNAGAGALLQLGQMGVLNGALAASAGHGGVQGAFGYRYINRGFSVDAQTQRATRGYGDLASSEGSPAGRAADRLSLNLALGRSQSLGLNVVNVRTPQADPARIVALAYSVSVGHGLYFSLSAFQDRKQPDTRGLFASLSYAFDNRVAANASAARQNGDRSRNLSLSRAPDIGGGLGWGVQSGGVASSRYDQAQVQYLGRAGQVTALTQSNNGKRRGALNLSGALVFMDGTVQPARQVGAGFALVSTDGVAGVPVIHENRQIGQTDAGGHLLVPNLVPYTNNVIAIDTDQLSAAARIPQTRTSVVPRQLSGVLARFPVERYSAATVVVHQPAGQPIAPGTPVLHVESGAVSVFGYDGMTFIDRLREDNRLLIGSGERQCEVRFSYRPEAGAALEQIGPLLCQPLQGAR